MYWSPWVQSPSVAEDMARQDRDVLAAAARDPSWVRYHITAMDRAGRALVRLGFAPV